VRGTGGAGLGLRARRDLAGVRIGLRAGLSLARAWLGAATSGRLASPGRGAWPAPRARVGTRARVGDRPLLPPPSPAWGSPLTAVATGRPCAPLRPMHPCPPGSIMPCWGVNQADGWYRPAREPGCDMAYWAASPPCRASWSSFSSSLDREVFRTVPPYLLMASTALSGVAFSSIKNSAEVPGWTMPRTWSWNCWSMLVLATFPITPPTPPPPPIPQPPHHT